MSYLLDALRKSEQERQQKTPIPGLQSTAVEWENSDDNRTRSPWLLVAVVAIVLNTVLLAVLVWRFGFSGRDNETTGNTGATTAQPSAVTTAAPTMPAVIVVQQPAAQAVVQEPIVVRERQTAAAPQTGAARYGNANTAGATGGYGNNSAFSNAPSNAVSSNSAGNNTTSSNANNFPANNFQANSTSNTARTASDEPLSAAERNDQEGELAAEHVGLPSVHGLPPDIRRQLPYLAMNSHIYANNAKDSFVMINGASYSPGQLIADGLKLVAVVPEGAVLEIHGTRFLLPALATFSP